MKKLPVLAALLVLGTLSSCATTHASRYAYGRSSCFAEQESDDPSRAIFGIPLVLGSLVFDSATWPVQAIFGVWPMWGKASLSMKPEPTRITYE